MNIDWKSVVALSNPQSCLGDQVKSGHTLINPRRSGAAVHFEVVGDLARGVRIQAHQNSPDAQHHPRLSVPLSLLAELQ